MHFLIITHVKHKLFNHQLYGYGPYVKEMNIWLKHVDKVTIVAPYDTLILPDPIDLAYSHSNLNLVPVKEFDFLTWKSKFKAILNLPKILYCIMVTMRNSDHIHLRCPGNMGLTGAFLQVFFPKKSKSAKYAGNWDWKSKQPFTYRLQQNMLRNPWISKNMRVLVYGNWEKNNKNLLPFFTASYSEKEIIPLTQKDLVKNEIVQLIYVGSLSSGKNPMKSVEVCHVLNNRNIKAQINIYGEGPEREKIQEYIGRNNLQDEVKLLGNVSSSVLKEAYINSHFLIFISQSEGRPKVVAESMFWGCLPLTSAVSCVPEMLGHGERGNLVEPDANKIADIIQGYILDPNKYHQKTISAMEWSRQYTLERFETEIIRILQNEV